MLWLDNVNQYMKASLVETSFLEDFGRLSTIELNPPQEQHVAIRNKLYYMLK
jgi:hypothetical protein